ncbi:MAG: putative glycine dehydrogenase (decarboxylating) subunit 2 [Planctomycetota bacterium]|nr:aminomethyl-transferring glycine dehydrogenase subunit GcvPB [Planctomycetota bacterium]GIK51886.1 MAG: putative glycine dehydrogenase (decarboxylating) subunit 2 [Planctomycetota bacterium]
MNATTTNPADALLFETSVEGRRCLRLPELDVPKVDIKQALKGAKLRAKPANLPEVGELDLVRHFKNLAQKNFSVDRNFYPLGSCTMKYNPKINVTLLAQPGFTRAHPHLPEADLQGHIELMYNLEGYLREVSGLPAITLQPAAGAQGEMTGLMVIKAYFEEKGEGKVRTEIVIPDSAHGTNPATAALAGFKTVTLKGKPDGSVDLELLKSLVGPQTAGMMITNPSTLGLLEPNMVEIARILHGVGAQLYMDGANMNAIQGIVRPGDYGVDVMHYNLHKTYSVPHGAGGPGAGPIAVAAHLEPYLPVPRPVKNEDGTFSLDYKRKKSIGKVRSFFGNYGALVMAYIYMSQLGREGVRRNAENAVLNANYLRVKLRNEFKVFTDRICAHEVVFTDAIQAKQNDIHALDVAKRLIDYNIHPMTIYFPQANVTNGEGAMMVEPTETESKQTLDFFIDVMKKIAQETKENPTLLKEAPHNMPVVRLDEVRASTQPQLYCPMCMS